MRLNFLSALPLRGFCAAMCTLVSLSTGLTATAFAQTASTPEVRPPTPLPSEASAAVPAITYRSAFADYQPWRAQTLAPWATPASTVQPNGTVTPALKIVKPHDHGASAH